MSCYYPHTSRESVSPVCVIFKASAIWADAFYKSKCPYVCLFVCLSVCLSVCSLLRYRLTVVLPPLPEVGCPIFLEIRNPWGKVMKRSGLRFEIFLVWKWFKIARQNLVLQNMVETTLPNGLETSGRRVYR